MLFPYYEADSYNRVYSYLPTHHIRNTLLHFINNTPSLKRIDAGSSVDLVNAKEVNGNILLINK